MSERKVFVFLFYVSFIVWEESVLIIFLNNETNNNFPGE